MKMDESSKDFVLDDTESHVHKTYIYKYPIEHVYKALTNKELLAKFSEYKVNIKFSLNDTTLDDEGNEISLNINNQLPIVMRIINVIKSKYYYQIKIKVIKYPIECAAFTITIELFWDTIKEVTIFIGQINVSKSSSRDKIISLLNNKKLFFIEEFEEYLKNTTKNLEQDESILVNKNIDIIIKFINEIQNIQLLLNMPNTEVSNEGNNIIKVVDKNNNNIIRLIQREQKIENSNYNLILESFDSIKFVPLQSMEIQLIKITDDSTLIIYKNIIPEYIPYNILASNSANKKKILKKVKKILENNYNPKEKEDNK